MRWFDGNALGITPRAKRWCGIGVTAAPLAFLLAAALSGSSACAPGPYTCSSATQCVSSSGVQGECEESGFCSYPDPTCSEGANASFERYAASAGGSLANECVPVAANSCVSQIAVGQDWSCYLRTDGTVWCWGDNSNGMIGQEPSSTTCPGIDDESGAQPCIPTPTQIPGLGDSAHGGPVVAVRLAEYHGCALASDSTVWCWGFNDQSNLGQCQSATELVQSPMPLQVFYPAPPILDAGAPDAAGAEPTATWSSVASTSPNAGAGVQQCSGAPLKIIPPNTQGLLETFTVGGEHTCVIDTNNELLCWGENQTTPVGGQAGQDFNVFPTVEGPLRVNGTNTTLLTQQQIVSVQAGDDYTCLLTGGQVVFCWGGNQDGELGTSVLQNGQPVANPNSNCTSDGTTTLANCTWSSSPTIISIASGVSGLTVDDETACALTQGAVQCWGNATSGVFDNASDPVQSIDYPDSLKISATALLGGSNAETFCVENNADAVSCWGANNLGQAASTIGTTTNLFTPTPAFLTAVDQLEVGQDHGCALTKEGEVYCWGDNSYGELGQGTTSTTPNPVPQRINVDCSGASTATIIRDPARAR